MTNRNRKIIFALFALLCGAMGACFLSAPFAGESYPLDDAWIHSVYARNLADGFFFSYNPPDPEAGFSSPLWIVVTAVAHLFTHSVLATKVAGLLLLFLLALVLGRAAGLAAGALILLDPLWQFSAVSGMEVTLFAFFCVLALERAASGKPGQAGCAAALALLSRPEGMLLALILPALFFERKKRWFLLVLPSLAAAGLWVTFCLRVTGRPLPNTFYAKAGLFPAFPGESLLQYFTRSLTDLFQLLGDTGAVFPFTALALALAALLVARRRIAVGALLLFLGLFFGTWFTRPVLRIDAFYWERYFVPATCGLYLLMGLGLQALWRQGRGYKALAAAAFLATVAGGVLHLGEKRQLYADNCRDIARYNVAAGRWIAEHTQPGERIAVQDAGAIRYFGNRNLIDLAGLNSDPSSFPPHDDMALLARDLDVDRLVLFRRHRSGRGGFVVCHEISYDDYSLYVHPERFTLLVLKKGTQRN